MIYSAPLAFSELERSRSRPLRPPCGRLLIDDFVDDRARPVGAWIEEQRIIRVGRSAELLGELLNLFLDALRQFGALRDVLVAGPLGRPLRLAPLLFAHGLRSIGLRPDASCLHYKCSFGSLLFITRCTILFVRSLSQSLIPM